MDKSQKHKGFPAGRQGKKVVRHVNTLESLKDIGGSTLNSIKKDVVHAETFMDQVFGPRSRNFSGEFSPGESIEIKDIFTGKHEETQKLKKQLAFERRIRQEESVRIEKRGNELRIQLHALREEIVILAQNTQELGEETQIAAMQAPVEPGIYHVLFFEKLLEFIKSFRKKIEEASVWLHATNKRAQKMNYWARYKKHGGKFLLSGEHYLTRSAG